MRVHNGRSIWPRSRLSVPEGHTIHRLAQEHTRTLAGFALHVWSPSGRRTKLAAQLDCYLLEHIEAHGKHLFYYWCAAPVLHVHLGLFGSFRESPTGSAPPRATAQLSLEGPTASAELVGAITCELIDHARVEQIVLRLGPDVLDASADPERGWQRLQRSSAPIGAALLDQHIVSGVGNVFRVEALFVNGIHPERPGNTLTRVEFDALWHTLETMLRAGACWFSVSWYR